MPFTTDFNRIRRKFSRLYDDRAKAETFAFKEAFDLNVKTFEGRRRNFKKQKESIFDM